jgi:hypothetical protein
LLDHAAPGSRQPPSAENSAPGVAPRVCGRVHEESGDEANGRLLHSGTVLAPQNGHADLDKRVEDDLLQHDSTDELLYASPRKPNNRAQRDHLSNTAANF